MQISITKYDKNKKIIDCCKVDKTDCTVDVFGAQLMLNKKIEIIDKNITKEIISIKILSHAIERAAIFFDYTFDEWEKQNYVLAPAALYNGNRFDSIAATYPPMLSRGNNLSADMKTIISDVPRLSMQGNYFTEISVGDLATPCFAYFNEKTKIAEFFFFNQQNLLGNYGIRLEENSKTLKLRFSSPCVREKKYTMCNSSDISYDHPAKIKMGDIVSFECMRHKIECQNIFDFYRYYFNNRHCFIKPEEYKNQLPWGLGAKLIEQKYNENNWQKKYRFYRSSEASSGIYREWQTGWVGGGINTLYNLSLGNELSKERAISTINFVFEKVQSDSGLMYGIFCDGMLFGDDFHNAKNADIVMSRKNADLLYYLVKQMTHLRACNSPIPPHWFDSLRKFANAFCEIIDRYHHAGQFINIKEKTILIGATSSAGIVCAALALCSHFFDDIRYLTTAERAAGYYFENYISKGLTNGGPGEILQSPDSESAFGLLESYVALYEMTRDGRWLNAAEAAAHQCSSWCVSYDFKYDKLTQFSFYDIKTRGAVFANVQNKHAAPGICTLSGSMLFRLFRATGNIEYLHLLKEIAHNLTQFISTKDRPLYDSYIWNDKCNAKRAKLCRRGFAQFLHSAHNNKLLKPLVKPLYNRIFNAQGRINERVNLSDWEGANNVGELPKGSCWCEVSMLLTYLEVPGVYIDKSRKFIYTLDHILAEMIDDAESLIIRLTNPTCYASEYRLFVDSDPKTPIIDCSLLKYITIKLEPEESKTIKI